MRFVPLGVAKVRAGDTLRDPDGKLWHVVKVHPNGAVEAAPVEFLHPNAKWFMVQRDEANGR